MHTPRPKGWPFTELVARVLAAYVIIMIIIGGTAFLVFLLRLTYLLMKAKP